VTGHCDGFVLVDDDGVFPALFELASESCQFPLQLIRSHYSTVIKFNYFRKHIGTLYADSWSGCKTLARSEPHRHSWLDEDSHHPDEDEGKKDENAQLYPSLEDVFRERAGSHQQHEDFIGSGHDDESADRQGYQDSHRESGEGARVERWHAVSFSRKMGVQRGYGALPPPRGNSRDAIMPCVVE
jgi:hypothetical protein